MAVTLKQQRRSIHKSGFPLFRNLLYARVSSKFALQLRRLMRRHGVWKSIGSVVGAAILFLNLDNPASAQVLFQGAETAVTSVFQPFLPSTQIIAFIFGAARFLIFAGALGLVAMAVVEARRGGSWEPWVTALASLAAAIALLQGASMMIFGAA